MKLCEKKIEKALKSCRKSHQRTHVLRFIEQGGRCYYCQRNMWHPLLYRKKTAAKILGTSKLSRRRSTAEHLKRKADGGGNSRKNLVAACYDCNSKRGETSVEDHKAAMQRAGQNRPPSKRVMACDTGKVRRNTARRARNIQTPALQNDRAYFAQLQRFS